MVSHFPLDWNGAGVTLNEVPMIRVENLNKSFSGKRVLKDIEFEVSKGEFFVIVGYSGSGKSTLLRILAGLETPESGKVFFDGEDVTNLPPQKRRIGMVFQDYAVWPHMTVRKNIEFVLQGDHTALANKDEVVKELLKKVGLMDKIDSMPSQLSGGQLQRVALARALAVKPKILLMDEPLSNLDRQVKKNLQLEILSITRNLNITTLFVTHDQEEAQLLSDRIAVMNAGVIEQIGDQKTFYYDPVNNTVAGFMDEIITFRGHVNAEKNSAYNVTINGREITVSQINKSKVTIGADCMVSVRIGDLKINDNGWINGTVVSDKFYSGSNHLIVSLEDGSTINIVVEETVSMQYGSPVRLSPADNRAFLFTE